MILRQILKTVDCIACFRRTEICTHPEQAGFMNLEIFQGLHFCSVAIVAITGETPNCFIELGYALGRMRRVVVTAIAGNSFAVRPTSNPLFLLECRYPIC
jgi:hypothetical protein